MKDELGPKEKDIELYQRFESFCDLSYHVDQQTKFLAKVAAESWNLECQTIICVKMHTFEFLTFFI